MWPEKVRPSNPVLFLVCALPVPGQVQQISSPSPNPMNVEQLYGGFLCDWVGQLEYRVSDNSRVFLPTWLEITRTSDGRSLRFAYVYDDGPTKIVRELSVITLTTPKPLYVPKRDPPARGGLPVSRWLHFHPQRRAKVAKRRRRQNTRHARSERVIYGSILRLPKIIAQPLL